LVKPVDYTMTNIKNFSIVKIVDFVPKSPILNLYGFVNHTHKNIWLKWFRFHYHINSFLRPK